MQTKGQEQKKLIEAIAQGPGQKKVELYLGRIESLLENAAKQAGLTRTQYKCLKKAGKIDTRKFARGRSKSNRAQAREAAREQHYQEQWEEHDDRLRRTEEAKERTRKVREEKQKTGARTTSGEGVPGKGETQRENMGRKHYKMKKN